MPEETLVQALRRHRGENTREDNAALEKSRLHKVRLDLLAELQSVTPERKQEIISRLRENDRRRDELEAAMKKPSSIAGRESGSSEGRGTATGPGTAKSTAPSGSALETARRR